jgi:tRNA(Met) C34 N-acetyltransferase TmcA
MALLVASHYKNTPNDLLLLADAPAHQLYVLLGPVDETQNALPDVLAVVQVRGRSLWGKAGGFSWAAAAAELTHNWGVVSYI